MTEYLKSMLTLKQDLIAATKDKSIMNHFAKDGKHILFRICFIFSKCGENKRKRMETNQKYYYNKQRLLQFQWEK